MANQNRCRQDLGSPIVLNNIEINSGSYYRNGDNDIIQKRKSPLIVKGQWLPIFTVGTNLPILPSSQQQLLRSVFSRVFTNLTNSDKH